MALDKNTIGQFITPHDKGEGGGGTTIVMNNGKNGSLPADINVSSINATSGNISNLTGRSMTFNDAQFIYLASENGAITKLSGTDLQYVNGTISSLASDSITTGKLKATEAEIDKAQIKDILSTNITTDYLTVTKQAHFFELIIDKIKSVGGQIILTPASCIADYVEPVVNNSNTIAYDVWFRADNDEGREITNDWRIDDQAICQNFNNATAGVNQNIQNKYYWRLVTAILDDKWVNLRTGEKLSTDQPNPNDTAVTINTFSIGAYDENTDETSNFNHTYFNIAAQRVDNVPMAEWTAGTDTVGTMKTYNTIFGIQIMPKTDETGADSNVAVYTVVPNSLTFTTSTNTNLNVGIYYADDTSQYFPTDGPKSTYTFELNTNAPIEAIVINNSDEPNWHLCHGIRLGNDNSDPDDPQVDVKYQPYGPTPSVPEIGDNIIQLGYRYNKYNESDEEYDVRRASAIIIASYHTPDPDIYPPSYAQYQKITDFSLNKNTRGTYMDATGAYIKGTLITTSGKPIDITDDGLQVNTNYYRLICNENPITKPATSKTVRFTVFSVEDGIGTEMTAAQLNGWTLKIGSSTLNPVQNQNYFEVTINSTDTSIEAKLYDNTQPNPILKDTYIGSIINFEDVNDGLPGNFTEWIYKNGVTAGSLPTNGTDLDNLDNGWSKTATTPDFANNEFTWCSYRNNTWIRTANDPAIVYGDWEPAYRITGNNGQPGEDGTPGTAGANGKYIEFIYKHFAEEHSFGPNDDDNPANWEIVDRPDYYAYGWEDNPQGLGQIEDIFYQFEYMSQREFDGEHFGEFTEPVIWSRWGQNGKDGDGYEYIYRLSDTVPNNPNTIRNGEVNPTGIANGTDQNKNQDEWVPNGWTDDPQGVSSLLGEHQEWVSMRKKSDGDWYEFSDPALWAQYVPKGAQGAQGSQGYNGRDGSQGAQGAQGSQGYNGRNGRDGIDGAQGSQGYNGRDGEYFELVPIREVFTVKLTGDKLNTTAYSNIRGEIYTDLIYAIVHIKGNYVTYLNAQQIRNYGLNIISDNLAGLNSWNISYANDSVRYVKVSLDSNTSSNPIQTYDAIRINITNFLTWTNNSGVSNYNNYYYLYNNNLADWMPTRLNIRLLSNGIEYDNKNIDLIFNPSHIFSVTDTALNSIYQGLSGSTGKWSTTGFSNIKQTWDKINLSINNTRSLYTDGEIIDINTNISGTGLEQYAFYRSETETKPSTPSGDPSSAGPVYTTVRNEQWTVHPNTITTSEYRYVYISYRSHNWNTATGQFESWSWWSEPQLYSIYGVPKQTINSAQLNIEADKIESKVTQKTRELMPINLFTDPNFYNTKDYWLFYNELASFWQKGSFTVDTYSSSTGARELNLIGTTSTAYYIEQPIVLLPNTTYTLSLLYRDEGNASVNNGSSPLRFAFYSSGSSTSYPIIASHQTNNTLRWGQYDSGDHAYEFTFQCPSSTTAYERRYVTFTTSAQLPTTPIYFWLFTYTGSTSVIRNTHIAELQLEQNSTYSAWTANSSYNSSLISQTANNISLQVQSEDESIKNGLRATGIDITTGKININADNTNINGNLNVYNANEGLQIYDSSNVPKVSILNKNIGNNPSAVTDYKTVEFVQSIMLNPGTNTFNANNFSNRVINLGTFINNTLVTLSGFSWRIFTALSKNGSSWYTKNVISGTPSLAWTGLYSGSKNGTGTLDSLNNKSFTYTGQTTTLNFDTISGTVSKGSDDYCMVTVQIIGKVNYVSNSGVLIGKDGISVQSDSGNKYTWIDNTQFLVKNGNASIRVKDGKIQRNNGRNSAFGDISSTVPINLCNSYTCSPTVDEAFIIMSNDLQYPNNKKTIYLPTTDVPRGKIYYIKNIAGVEECTVYTKDSGRLMAANSNEQVSSIQIGRRSTMFIWTGSVYVHFYCG